MTWSTTEMLPGSVPAYKPGRYVVERYDQEWLMAQVSVSQDRAKPSYSRLELKSRKAETGSLGEKTYLYSGHPA